MIIKLIGAGMVIGAGAFGGILLGRQLKLRQEKLCQGRNAVELLQAQIRSTGAALPEVLRQTGIYDKSEYGETFSEIAERLLKYDGRSVAEIWEMTSKEHLVHACMREEDIRSFLHIGEQIGRTDRKLQEQLLDRYLHYADREIALLDTEVKEKTKLYRNLGMLFGGFVVIILF